MLQPDVADNRESCRRRLQALRDAPGALDIVEFALLISAEAHPGLDVDEQHDRIASLRNRAAERARGVQNPLERLDRIREWLFVEERFRGNLDDYDDPRNSYLHEVLDRRLGIPLTLSILYLEVARGAGFEARGVGLPGHFVCGVERDGRTMLVDPFHAGHVISEDDCRDLVARSTGRPDLFRRELLKGATTEAMASRLLQNLKRIHLTAENFAAALDVVDHLLILDPDDAREIRDGGILKAHLGRPGAAVSDLQTYLELVPEAPDADAVRGRLAALRRKVAEAN